GGYSGACRQLAGCAPGANASPYAHGRARLRAPVKLSEALAMEALKDARVVAGGRGLENEVRWAHVVEIPDPLPWVKEGQLLLTTGYAWPRTNLEQHRLLRGLVERGLAGIGLAVPKYLERFPRAVVTEADRLGLPLMQIP